MQIIVNGQDKEVAEGLTIAQLLGDLDLSGTRYAVEVNRHVIPRDQHACHALANGDEVEVVQFVGGG